MEAGSQGIGPQFIPRITRRCLVSDLGLGTHSIELSIDELAEMSDVVAAFRDRRAEVASAGQEPIRSLLPEIVAFSLHVGRQRGATWLHREPGAIWLLAVGYHREGHGDDAYEYFGRLKAAGQILPDRADLVAFARAQAPSLARSLLDDVPALVAAAREHPREIHTSMIGGRIRVRLAYEDSDPPMLTVAIGQRLWPGDMPMPGDWLLRVAAAFLPDTSAADLSVAFDLAGRELEPDEVAFCDFSE